MAGKGKESVWSWWPGSNKTSNSEPRPSSSFPSATVESLRAELEEEKAAVNRVQGELDREKAAVKSLEGELEEERAEVSSLNGLLHKKETEVHRLSGQLKEGREAVRRLEKEKGAAIWSNTGYGVEEAVKELTSARKELQESVESRIQRHNKGINRAKTMVKVYQNYRRWCEDQSSRPLVGKYDPWELDMVVNKRVESTGTTRCGAVYKSTLNQKDVVIAILNRKSKQIQQDFDEKVEILTRIWHPNLVSCIAAYEKQYTLICEHSPNGTLQDQLVNEGHMASFSWEERVEISATICSTLLFLHNTKPTPIIYGDLKAENICFDADKVCRLSVFGMSYRPTQHATNNNKAPSNQSDICDFGIVLLQMVTGQREKGLVRMKVLSMMGDVNLFQEKSVGWQREVLKQKNIVDSRLDNCPTEQAVKMLMLGLRCSNPEENQRPDLATEVWTQIQSIKMGAAESRVRGLF